MSLVNRVCKYCGNNFHVEQRFITYDQKSNSKNKGTRGNFCSKKCQYEAQITKKKLKCASCCSDFERHLYQIKRSKSGNSFCSLSCSATHHNKNKKTGTRRSKLEVFIEEQIKKEFPKLKAVYNSLTSIGHELDFYFPTLKLAIEINGIFHYEPIYGEEKLNRIKQNDKAKKKSCKENNIKLFVYKDKFDRFTLSNGEKAWKKIKEKLA